MGMGHVPKILRKNPDVYIVIQVFHCCDIQTINRHWYNNVQNVYHEFDDDFNEKQY